MEKFNVKKLKYLEAKE